MVDEYSKFMIKADEQSAQAAGFGMAVNVGETPYMNDYIMTTREILAAIVQFRLDGTAKKNIRTTDGNDEECGQASNIQHTCF